MTRGASVLCPVDFSSSSRGALRYATAIAEHFGADLTLLTVSDPLLAEAADLRMGSNWLLENLQRELQRFYADAFDHRTAHAVTPSLETATGKPAPEILRVARERSADVIVMSSHGLTGIRKLFFGAVTERVLRETTIPVLVTPAADEGPRDLSELQGTGRPVLVPIDLTPAAERQVKVGRGIAEALGVPLLLSHIIEPLKFPIPVQISLPHVDAERRTQADQVLNDLLSRLPASLKKEALIAYGDPAEEVAKIAHDRHAGLVVMGLQASTVTGPRMGSVTYRVLCLSPTLVLALPPETTHQP